MANPSGSQSPRSTENGTVVRFLHILLEESSRRHSMLPIGTLLFNDESGCIRPSHSSSGLLYDKTPFKIGFTPKRWKFCLDVMLLKKSGVTDLSGLCTIVLFPVDCNFAFKHIGRTMMNVAEHTKSLAPEQYSSGKKHKAIDLAVNKALTFDILRQLKRSGAICSNDAKSCYDLIGHTQASLSRQSRGTKKHHQLPVHNSSGRHTQSQNRFWRLKGLLWRQSLASQFTELVKEMVQAQPSGQS
jgi:hypothetical protein